MSFPNRVIQAPGSELLPPSREPIIPPDMKDNEKVVVKAPVAPTEEDKGYWRMRDAYIHHPNVTLFAWKNDPGGAYGFGRAIDTLPSPCLFEFKPKPRKQGLPDLWEAHGLFIVSTCLLNMLLQFDAEAIVHRPIVMRDLEGTVFDEDHHFMDVVRCIEAVDYANSDILYIGPRNGPDGSRYPALPASYHSARMLNDIDPSLKIFRHKHRDVFVRAEVHDAVANAKPKIRNIDFSLPTRGF